MTTQKDNSHAPPEPLAIIGIGCLFPRADSLEAYWSNIKHGVDAIRDIPPTHWRPEDYFDSDAKRPDMTYARRGGFLDPIEFDPLRYGISPNNIEATDTTQLLGLVAADMALRDAGYATSRDATDGRQFDRDRTSVILGVTGALELVIPLGARLGHPIWRRALSEAGVDDRTADEVVARIAEGYVPWQENSFPGLLGNVAAGRIANRFDLGGTNCVVDAACASSLSAIHMAAMELHSSRADMVLTGGLDTFNDIFMYMCFSKTPALSPTGDSRPFAADSDGTILGEGLGVVVLKRLSDAVRDGDRIYCTIRGIGSSSDGAGNAIYAPSATGQMKALRAGYRESGATPDTIELVEAHGTGTKVGDAVEAGALADVFREARREGTWCALGSVKSMIGHTKAAAGVAGLIKAAMALYDKVLPPTLKVNAPLERLEPGQAPVYINTQARPWLRRPVATGSASAPPRRAAVSAFGFGGSNFHAVLEEVITRRECILWDDRVLLFAWSGASRDELAAKVTGVDKWLSWTDLRAAAAFCWAGFRTTDRYRAACVLTRDGTPVERVLASASRLVAEAEQKSWSVSPDGAWCGVGPVTGKLAIVFPGQGSQSVGMLRELACTFPQVLDALAAADEAFGETEHGRRLTDRIYPMPVFDEAARNEQERALADTRVAQPSLGAVEWGAFQVLSHFGVRADATAGHSFGELVALCAAGRIDPSSLHRLAVARGRLMANGSGDRGAMLAVAAAAERIESLLSEAGADVVIANRNAPAQAVLSGATDEIEKAAAVLARQSIRTRRLNVSTAFHSPLVAAAERRFAQVLDEIEMAGGRCPVYANTTGAPYPADPPSSRRLLAGQLARPVEFMRQIQRMHNDGVRTFVEVGPGSVLTGLVRNILDGREHVAAALDWSSGKRGGTYDLACLLAQLATLGYSVELTKWDEVFATRTAAEPPKKPGMTIRLSGANYVKPRPVPKLGVAGPESAKGVDNKPKPPVGDESFRRPDGDSVTEGIRLPRQTRTPRTVNVQPTQTDQAMTQTTQPNESHLPVAGSLSASTDALETALRATEQGIVTLERMQQQTAELHRQYLEGQLTAQRCVQQLIEQQNSLLSGSAGLPVSIPQPPSVGALTAPASVSVPDAPRTTEKFTAQRADAAEAMRPPHFDQGPVAVQAAATLPQTASDESYAQVLLEVISDKTGYPIETLELSMRLDADLGIDSIKRVEILSALQERLPDAPAVKADDLGTLQTLGDIVRFLEVSPVGGGGLAGGSQPCPSQTQGVPPGNFAGVLLEVVADKTGYPVETLELSMRLDADLGIDSIKRVEILSALQERLPDAPAVQSDDLGALQTLGDIVSFFEGPVRDSVGEGIRLSQTREAVGHEDRQPKISSDLNFSCRRVELAPLSETPARTGLDLRHSRLYITDDGAGLARAVADALGRRGVAALIIGLDTAPSRLKTSGLVLIAPPNPTPDFTWRALSLVQRFGEVLRHSAESTDVVLASVSRLGGDFGLTGRDDMEPPSSALAGLIKTAAHEWPEVQAKAIDIPSSGDSTLLADKIAEELLLAGPIEVGLTADERFRISLEPWTGGVAGKPPVQPGEVIVISGGARGIAAEVAVALAEAWASTLVLLGRTPEPTEEPDWLADLRDEAQIKRAIVQHEGSRLAPKALEFAYRRIVAQREIAATLSRIGQASARAVYHSIDVRDTSAVQRVLAEVRSHHGPIRGAIHAAGVLADRLIEDKTLEQFDEVFGVKVDGMRALLDATAQDDLRLLAVFSSSTARFGRKGQVDYAMANEVLNKMAQIEARRRPACRVVSFNWGPWDGGMVTPQLARMFTSEGVGLIGLHEGADFVVRQLATPPGGPVEIVVMGQTVNAQTAKRDRSTELQAATDAPRGELSPIIAFRRHIDVDSLPVLRSHVINGRAVVPMALVIEWLAHGAMHDNPGLLFAGFDDLRVFKGVILDPEASLELEVWACSAQADGDEEAVTVELRSGATLHARATVRLAARHGVGTPGVSPTGLRSYPQTSDEIYAGERLFHGSDLQGIEAVEGCGEAGIIGRAKAAPHPAIWIDNPLRSAWLADPLALDSAFQLAILWCQERRGAGSLPTRVERYRQFRRAFPSSGTKVVLRVTRANDHTAAADIEFLDDAGYLVARIEGYECVIDPSLSDAFARNQLVPQGR